MLLKTGTRQNKQNPTVSKEESWCRLENEATNTSVANIPAILKAFGAEEFQLWHNINIS